MENLYNVKLEAVVSSGRGHGVSEGQMDLVPEEHRNNLKLIDWSHSGLLAVAVNKYASETGNGASVLLHCAVALFDANEPHVVALRCPEPPNSATDSRLISPEEKEAQSTRCNGNTSGEVNGWLMSHCNYYTILSWHPHTNVLAAVKNNSSIDIWSNLGGFILNDFSVHLSVDCSPVLNRGVSRYADKQRDHFPVASFWINCEFSYKFACKKSSASSWNESETSNTMFTDHNPDTKVSLSANKELPLFDGNTTAHSIEESCYDYGIGVVTTTGYLVIVIFNTYFDYLKESCPINASAQKESDGKIGCIDNTSLPVEKSERVSSAVFFWESDGRGVASIQANGNVTMTKFQLCLIETNHNNNYESLEIVVKSMVLVKCPSTDLCPLSLMHANSEELVCLSETSSSYLQRMEVDVKEPPLDENIKKEPCEETNDDKQIVLTKFLIEKHSSKNAKPSSVEETKDVESESWKDAAEDQSQSTSIKSDELEDEETESSVLKVKNIGPFLGSGISKFQHACLPNNRLFEGSLIDENSPNFLICDSNSLQLFDSTFAKVECSEFSNAAMFVKSKLVSTDAKKEKSAKMMCLSPLALACAVYDPALESVEVSLLPCAIKYFSEKVTGSDSEGTQSDSERLLKVAKTLFVGGLCADKDLWDLTMLLRRSLSHEQQFTCLQNIFSISHHFPFWLEKVLFCCNALAFKESNCSHPLTCFGLNLQMNLSMISKFFRLIHNSVGANLWKKFDNFIDTSGPDLVDAVILTEFEQLLIKETEFMLILPHIQYIYDNLMLIFECFAQKRFSRFINLKALLLLFKNVLIFTTLWLSQSSLRLKHYPVIEKCTSTIDMKQFYSLVYQLNSVFSLGETPIEETLQPIINKIQTFLRLFKPVLLSQKLASLGCPHLTGVYGINSMKNAVVVPRDMESVMTFPSNCSESMSDDVRFMKLGVRPIVNLKRCVKCGRKQGLRPKKQFKWPLWEAMFDQSCICGGLWRRENRRVTFNSQANNANNNENASSGT